MMSKPEIKNDTGADKKSSGKAKGIIDKIKSIKRLDLIIAGVAVAVMLIIYFTTFIAPSGEDVKTLPAGDVKTDYCNAVVFELENKLSQVSGAGNVVVLINWESSVEQVPAASTGSTGSSSVITVGGQVYVLKSVYPKPIGVIIICDGANNISIKMSLISAVSSYFGIPENTITVLARLNQK